MNRLYSNVVLLPRLHGRPTIGMNFISMCKMRTCVIVNVGKIGTNILRKSKGAAVKFHSASFTTKNIPKKFRKPLLPFETEASAETDILLYACHKKERLFFLISMSGVFLFCVLMNSSELIYRYLGRVKTKQVTEQLPWYYWWRKINYDSPLFRNAASGMVILFGILVMAFGLAYPARMIREITLLKGGEKILLETYRPFGFTKKREIRLKDISAQWGQKEAKDHLPLKVRGTRFHFLVDQGGIYFNRRLFDQTVGLHRF